MAASGDERAGDHELPHVSFSLPGYIWLALLPSIVIAVVGLRLVERNLLYAGLCVAAAGLLMIIDYTPALDFVVGLYLGADVPLGSAIAELLKPPMPPGYLGFAIAVMVVGAVMEAVAYHRTTRISAFRP